MLYQRDVDLIGVRHGKRSGENEAKDEEKSLEILCVIIENERHK